MAEVLYQPFPMRAASRAQVWRFAPEYRRPRHFHAEPELNLVCAGTGAFGYGKRRIAVSAGDLLWWPPGLDHELLETSADFDLFVIGVRPEFSERVLGASALGLAGASQCARLPPAQLARLRTACTAPLLGDDTAAVERHVGDLWREAHAARPLATLHVLTRRALVNLGHEPDLERSDLAQAYGANPSELSRHFRRDTGITLTDYRTRLRLMRFIQAVDGGAPTLLSAACTSGFGSYSQFHRAFRDTFGCMPRAFFGTAARQRMRDSFAPW